MKNIKVTRRVNGLDYFYGMKIYADNRYLGKIASGTTKVFQVSEHDHHLIARLYWAKSQPFDLRFINNGDEIELLLPIFYNPLAHLGIGTMRIQSRIVRHQN